MSAPSMIAPSPASRPRHRAIARHADGLVGRTDDQRREIAERIGMVSAAKQEVKDREGRTRRLTAFEIALALGDDERSPRRRCTSCGSELPETARNFYPKGPGKFFGKCITCHCRDSAKHQASPTAKRNRADGKVKAREASRKYYRRVQAERKAAGLIRDDCPTLRQKLMKALRQQRVWLRRATEPARIERIKARMANLAHEIERIERQERDGIIPMTR